MTIGHSAPVKASPLVWAAYALLTIGASATSSSAYATATASLVVQREATMDSVGAGKNAYLVLLGSNLIASAGNLHRINAVVRAGRYFSASDLEAMKARVAEVVSKMAPLGSAAALAPEPH